MKLTKKNVPRYHAAPLESCPAGLWVRYADFEQVVDERDHAETQLAEAKLERASAWRDGGYHG